MNKKENPSFSRTELLLGKEGMRKLGRARVALFGLGGVGGHAFDALVRSGIGHITVVDGDRINETNLNRQLLATVSTVGMAKTHAAALRARDINPDCEIKELEIFYTPENADLIKLSDYDYVIDAIDTVSSKIELVERAKRDGVAIISSMGAGNKLDPTAFKVSDIYKTSVCPLARVMRTELRKRGIKKLKVVYSTEEPKTCIADASNGRRAPASISFVPSTVGLIIAGEVIKDIAGID